ncbi:MAG: pitrilysin family protein [Rhodospirillaceae bacterium]|nr:pitrilysin family protein [Rhodospirillaceae bacterium]
MRRVLSALLTAAFAVAVLMPASSPRAAVFEPTVFTLDNGLQVVVVENHRAPVVTHMVWYRVGSADELPGKSGIAHFLEHLMFRGTDAYAPGEFSQIVSRLGGEENAFTMQDATAYFQSVAVEHLDTVMALEADRMVNLHLSDPVVLAERDVIIEERHQRVDNDPGSRLNEMMRASLYLHHPYGTPIIGWEHEMSALTPDDAWTFYDRWYAPNNAILVVSGDVTPDQIRAMAEKHYGPIPSGDVPERVRLEEPNQTAPRRVVLASADVEQPSWSRLYLAPSYHAGATEHAYALQVLAEIIGEDSTSRLYRDLVIDRKIAAFAGAGYSPSTFDLGIFSFYVVPMPDADMTTIEAAIDASIADLLDTGVTDAEVAQAIHRLQASAIKARDSLSGPAQLFGRALTIGQTIEDVEVWPEKIGAVTAEAVMAAAREVLVLDRSVTGLLLTKPAS